MTQPHARPEDRCRSGIDSSLNQPWADTHAGCFRSEGFAEDLFDEAPPPASTRPRIGWRLRRAEGTLPLLGLAVVGVLGAFAR